MHYSFKIYNEVLEESEKILFVGLLARRTNTSMVNSMSLKLVDGEQKVYFKAGGEWCYVWTPPGFRVSKPAPVVVHNHGARGWVKDGSADWIEQPSKNTFLKAVMENGIVIAGNHACGDHWGNPCAVAANGALLKILDGCKGLNMSRLGLMGGGLGGALIWNSVLGPFAGRPKAVAVLQAVANLAAVVREKKFRAVCLQAYNIPEDPPDDKAIKLIGNSDPMPKLQSLRMGVKLPRTAIYHGSKDENIPAETNAIPLADALKKAGGEVELNLFKEVEHNVYAMGKPMEDRLRVLFSTL